MARPNPLRVMMAAKLPSKTIQRRTPYRPCGEEIRYTYDRLNWYIFDNALKQPLIKIKTLYGAWGICYGYDEPYRNTKSNCTIELSNKWYSIQWMVTCLAHEMCHQYQWDLYGPEREKNGKDWLMSHGPTFFEHRDRLAEYNIPLRIQYDHALWFQHQDLFLS